MSYVYVIKAEAKEGLKIGRSERPVRRAAAIWNEFKCVAVVLYCVKVRDPVLIEMEAHRLLRDKALGNEWFAISKAKAIATIGKAIQNKHKEIEAKELASAQRKREGIARHQEFKRKQWRKLQEFKDRLAADLDGPAAGMTRVFMEYLDKRPDMVAWFDERLLQDTEPVSGMTHLFVEYLEKRPELRVWLEERHEDKHSKPVRKKGKV